MSGHGGWGGGRVAVMYSLEGLSCMQGRAPSFIKGAPFTPFTLIRMLTIEVVCTVSDFPI